MSIAAPQADAILNDLAHASTLCCAYTDAKYFATDHKPIPSTSLQSPASSATPADAGAAVP